MSHGTCPHGTCSRGADHGTRIRLAYEALEGHPGDKTDQARGEVCKGGHCHEGHVCCEQEKNQAPCQQCSPCFFHQDPQKRVDQVEHDEGSEEPLADDVVGVEGGGKVSVYTEKGQHDGPLCPLVEEASVPDGGEDPQGEEHAVEGRVDPGNAFFIVFPDIPDGAGGSVMELHHASREHEECSHEQEACPFGHMGHCGVREVFGCSAVQME